MKSNSSTGKEAKAWMTLNSHGKDCLFRFLFAISASDILTSQLDYLHRKELIDYSGKLRNDNKKIHTLAGESLTDVGIETAKHYFPGAIKN